MKNINKFTVSVSGVGLGLHRSLLTDLSTKFSHSSMHDINFLEVAPENWINIGGRLGKQLRSYTERFPFLAHGLSLSLGSPAPLNIDLLKAIKQFMRDHKIQHYSEHLSYTGDSGNLYELLPIPFTEEAVFYIANRIRQTQDLLGEQISVENSTYYYLPEQEMTEHEFINAVLCEADCGLLLDVNNLFVNSTNHQYDALEFLREIKGDRISYIHIAGHDTETENFYLDTHGTPVTQGTWDLLQQAYLLFGIRPTLLERDNNIPPLNDIFSELDTIRKHQLMASSQ